MGAGLRRAGRPLPSPAGRRGRGEGPRSARVRGGAGGAFRGAERRGEGRGEGRGGTGRGAGKGEAPADNGAYVCLREWDGAAAAGGRRCAAAGPGPGPPGLRAARAAAPALPAALPSPTPARGPERGTNGVTPLGPTTSYLWGKQSSCLGSSGSRCRRASGWDILKVRVTFEPGVPGLP